MASADDLDLGKMAASGVVLEEEWKSSELVEKIGGALGRIHAALDRTQLGGSDEDLVDRWHRRSGCARGSNGIQEIR